MGIFMESRNFHVFPSVLMDEVKRVSRKEVAFIGLTIAADNPIVVCILMKVTFVAEAIAAEGRYFLSLCNHRHKQAL
jgi:hypothetical protein